MGTKKLEQRDRVSYSLSSAVKNYGTGFNVQVSYSTDVGDEETPHLAFKRARKFVEVRVAHCTEELSEADEK